MNLHHLGDALDHWKGSLFERLQKEQLLTKLAVDAMVSDSSLWTDLDWKLFATLLKISRKQILQHRASLALDRVMYFREIEHSDDIFLDPDTGFATNRMHNSPKHLRSEELHTLLAAHPSRIVCVYQHIRATTTFDRLNKIMALLSEQAHPFYCCSYESPTVAMLFFSQDLGRVEAIHRFHEELLGRHSTSRTSLWHRDKMVRKIFAHALK